MTLTELTARVAAEFQKHYGRAPRWIVAAPGRVNVIGEIERTVHAAEGIRSSSWPSVGKLIYASHASLRDDCEVSCAELDGSRKKD